MQKTLKWKVQIDLDEEHNGYLILLICKTVKWNHRYQVYSQLFFI